AALPRPSGRAVWSGDGRGHGLWNPGRRTRSRRRSRSRRRRCHGHGVSGCRGHGRRPRSRDGAGSVGRPPPCRQTVWRRPDGGRVRSPVLQDRWRQPDCDRTMIDRTLTGRTILAVFAHPDDESLACGGTLARLAAEGFRVTVLSATHGERGGPIDTRRDDALGKARALEICEAAAALNIAEVVIGGYPDGDLRWDHVG